MCSTRLTIGIYIFFSMVTLTIMRSSFNLSLQAMVQSQNVDENGTQIQLPDV